MQEDSTIDPSLCETQKEMEFEFVSISDGKETVAKAANVLFNKYYLDGDTEKPFLTDADLSEALENLGWFFLLLFL